MASDSDSIQPPDDDSSVHKVGSIAERTLSEIERDYVDLREQAQQLLSEKLDLENKVAKQKQTLH